MRLLLEKFVPGDPKPQPRQRHFARKCGNKWLARSYDPGTAEGWKSQIALAIQKHLPAQPFDGPLRVDLTFFMRRPLSLKRKKDPDGVIWCANHRHGDRDNLDKAILDCLTQCGFWVDDALVCDGVIRKYFAPKRGVPGVQIRVYALEHEDIAGVSP